MSKFHDDRYDEMKSLIKKTKLLYEQDSRINIGKSIEDRIQRDTEGIKPDYETADSGEEN